jgi:para-aminobenzoate synthetase component 1
MDTLSTQFKSANLVIKADAITPSVTVKQVFTHLAQQPWSVLFDTAHSTQSDGRYDILMWHPCFSVMAKDQRVWLNDNDHNTTTELTSPPLQVVNELVDNLIASTEVAHSDATVFAQLPFVLGAAGLCSYDLGRYYEALPTSLSSEYLCPDLAIGIYSQSLIFDNQCQRWYLCYRDNIDTSKSLAWIQQLDITEPEPPSSFKLTSAWQGNMDKTYYLDALGKIHQYLVAGDCYQVNFAQRFSAHYRGSEWQAYCYLSEHNQAPFSVFMQLPQSTILSISPERFLRIQDGHIQTKPIKGTRPRSHHGELDAALAQELLSAEKDRAENLMIVDLLRNDLSKHSRPGSVKVPHLFVLESYAAVHHLVSTVTASLNDTSTPLDLFSGAFPGGSITGAPKIRAMEIIEELEPNRRSVYCGSMMYYGLKRDLDSSICIRTLLAENQQLHCWAGGGIVVDSTANDEYQETLDKVSRILPVLEDFGE